MSVFDNIIGGVSGKRTIHLAVIGFPASGKSYLLSDMIATLAEMGYESELPELTFQHSSFGAFYYDAFNNDTGGMKQTPPSACRPANHYGAVMRHKGTSRRIAVDFLNIPGETFQDADAQLRRYYNLRDALQSIKGKGLLELTVWRNPSGKECYVLEPALSVRGKYSLLSYDGLSKLTSNDFEGNAQNYRDWAMIYSELNYYQYTLCKRKPVSGDYVLKHFFELNTDSVFATIVDVWQGFANGLDKTEYLTSNAFNDFYYMHYSSVATDMVICDKIFEPGNNAAENYNFLSMIETLKDLIRGNKRTNVYLAFRGADLMLKPCTEAYKERCNLTPLNEGRMGVYSLFESQIQAVCLDGAVADDALLDVNPDGYCIASGGDLRSHLRNRLGGDIAHGFKSLMHEAYGSIADSEGLPPHVYFTATPIDEHFEIYDNDRLDATRFVRSETDAEGNKHWKAFHIEVTRGGKRQFCFGTYQLMCDILKQNNITLK